MVTLATGPVGPDQLLRTLPRLCPPVAAPDLMSGQQAAASPNLLCTAGLRASRSVWFRNDSKILKTQDFVCILFLTGTFFKIGRSSCGRNSGLVDFLLPPQSYRFEESFSKYGKVRADKATCELSCNMAST